MKELNEKQLENICGGVVPSFAGCPPSPNPYPVVPYPRPGDLRFPKPKTSLPPWWRQHKD